MNDIQDKIVLKFFLDGKFSVKPATCTNSDQVFPLPRAELLNQLCKLKIIPKVKLLSWKLIRG